MNVADQKNIAITFRSLASDPSNQLYIAKDQSIMQNVLSFLDSPDIEVVTIGLQSLEFLSRHPGNSDVLPKVPGMMLKLAALSDHSDDNVQKLANETLNNLSSFVNRDANSGNSNSNNANNNSNQADNKASPRYLSEVVLRVDEMNSVKQRQDLEKALIGIKGVISVTMDPSHKRVSVYTNRKESDILPLLTTAASELQMNAVRVSKEKSAITYHHDPSDKENAPSAAPAAVNKRPSYLSSGAVMTKGPSYVTDSTATPRKGALTPYAGSIKDTTLQARQQQQTSQKVAENVAKGRVKSLFGSVTSFFW